MTPQLLETGEAIEANVSDSTLTVRNKFFRPVYYFTAELELLSRINYVIVSTDENRIDPFQQISIPLTDIDVTEPDQNIAFLYWVVQEPETDEIFNILIERD